MKKKKKKPKFDIEISSFPFPFVTIIRYMNDECLVVWLVFSFSLGLG